MNSDIFLAQYHRGLDQLWAALGLTGVQDTDVFTLAAERIRSLEAGVWVVVDISGQLRSGWAFHNKVEADQFALKTGWRVQRLPWRTPRRAEFCPPLGHKCSVSTGIHDGLTFGTGKLSNNGFWSEPCYECAREYEKQFPDSGKCWPFVR